MAALLTYPPALLDREHAAAYLSVSPRTLDEWQSRSLLIPVDVDGMKRFRRSDLDEFAASRPDWEKRAKA